MGHGVAHALRVPDYGPLAGGKERLLPGAAGGAKGGPGGEGVRGAG